MVFSILLVRTMFRCVGWDGCQLWRLPAWSFQCPLSSGDTHFTRPEVTLVFYAWQLKVIKYFLFKLLFFTDTRVVFLGYRPL